MRRNRKDVNEEINALKMQSSGEDQLMIKHQVMHNDNCFYGYIPFINGYFDRNNLGYGPR